MEPRAYREMLGVQQTHWWFAVRREFLQSWVRIGGTIPCDGCILEVGAGTGANLDTLRAFGRVTAVEPDPFACDYISRHFDVEAVRASLPEVGAGLRDFDLVVALDVLEHMDDDIAALKSIHGMLREQGRVVATVPAFQFMWSAHDEKLHHKRRYRASELVSRMEEAGFRTEYDSYFNFFLFPAAAFIRLLDRFFRGLGEAGSGSLHPFLNGLMARIFGMEVSLSRHVRFPFGLSLVVVGSKPG